MAPKKRTRRRRRNRLTRRRLQPTPPDELKLVKDQLATVRNHLQVLLGYLQPQWISDSVRTSHQALVRFGREGTI